MTDVQPCPEVGMWVHYHLAEDNRPRAALITEVAVGDAYDTVALRIHSPDGRQAYPIAAARRSDTPAVGCWNRPPAFEPHLTRGIHRLLRAVRTYLRGGRP